MAQERVERRLAAILAADVVGYSRLMGEDEAGTRARFNAHLRELIEPAIASRRGRIVKTTGDGLLIEYASVVDAVQCAVDIQKGMAERNANEPDDERIVFRIGVNLGDVIIEGEDIHGDGVNVAARLEALADPGGICVSGDVYRQCRGKLDVGFDDLGEQEVKNIAEPVPAYRVLPEGQQATAPLRMKASSRWRVSAIAAAVLVVVAAGGVAWWQPWLPDVKPASIDKMAFPLPDKPSIAVLPFANLSGDKEQEYFADGLTEDIITNLASFPNLFVIARTSTNKYKGKAVDIRDVAHDLGVRYVLEGSVRRAGNTVRITAQLIDALGGNHIWANKYDREFKDIFAVQDDITGAIGSRLVSKVAVAEWKRGSRKGTKSAEAYDLFLLGWNAYWEFNPRSLAKAIRYLERAIEKDPGYARAYANLAVAHRYNVLFKWGNGPKDTIEHAFELAQKAVALDPADYQTHGTLSNLYVARQQIERSVEEAEKAVALSPSNPDPKIRLAYSLTFAGRAEEAVKHAETAMRLNPYPRFSYPQFAGFAYYMAKRFDKAAASFEAALRINPRNQSSRPWLAAAYAQLGRMEEANATAKAHLEKNPRYSIRIIGRSSGGWKPQDRELLVKGLRMAGFPDNPPLKLPDKPSIAVLPFTNMSGDAEQEYFADGMTEDIITDLSKISGLFVIARNSSFAYKGKSSDLRAVGRELGVRYVLEGSVRRAGETVRINAQLVDAAKGGHLWAERYDGNLKDVFALQDKVTQQIVAALAVKLTAGEGRKLAKAETENLEAYDLVLRARKLMTQFDHKDANKARDLLTRAIELDAGYVEAYSLLGLYYFDEWRLWGENRVGNLSRAQDIAEKAIELSPLDPAPHALLAQIHQFSRRFDAAIAQADAALALEPNDAVTLANLGSMLRYAHRAEQAAEVVERAIRLDPFHPPNYLGWLGDAYFLLGRLNDCSAAVERGIALEPDFIALHVIAAKCYSALDNEKRAREAGSEVLRNNPRFTLRAFAGYVPFSDKRDLRRNVEMLRKAGLPE